MKRPLAKVGAQAEVQSLRCEHLEEAFCPCQAEDAALHAPTGWSLPHPLVDAVLAPLEEKQGGARVAEPRKVPVPHAQQRVVVRPPAFAGVAHWAAHPALEVAEVTGHRAPEFQV